MKKITFNAPLNHKEEIIMIHIIILHIIIFCQICKTYFKRKFSKYNEVNNKREFI